MSSPDIHDLPLVGGHPALDLVNTVEPRFAAPDRKEHLTGPAELLVWARRTGLVDDAAGDAVAAAWAATPADGTRALDAVLEIREALHTVLLALLGPNPAATPAVTRGALRQLGQRWAASAARSELVLDPPGARLVVGSDPATLLVDRAASAAVDLLRAGDLDRLSACPAELGGCGWVYLDRSRNRSRRWCQMADCGTAVKVHRLTARRRAARSDPTG